MISLELAQRIVLAALVYAGLGLGFALAFVVWGARRLDPAAASGSLGFRALAIPASVALWPYLALRWLRSGGLAGGVRRTSDAHRDAARTTQPEPRP